MAQLRQHAAELASLNAQVVAISFGTALGAQTWLEETGAPFKLLLDPNRVAYRAYGLEHSLVRSWGWNVWWRYIELLLVGQKWRGIQGDSGQLGGDFIVDTDGVIRWAYRSHDPTDRPSMNQLLAVLSNCSATNRKSGIEHRLPQ